MERYSFQANPGLLVILVRHGKTGLNDPSNPKVRGWEDIPLASEGRSGAQITANKLKPYNPKYVFSSDLMRDTETAEIIGKSLGIANETDFDARTWDVGSYSGKPESEVNPAIEELYSQSWKRPPGSTESFDDFSRRWLDFLERKMQFASINDFRPTIIVTHGRDIALTDSYLNLKVSKDGLMPMPAGYAFISVGTDRRISFEIQGESECVCKDV